LYDTNKDFPKIDNKFVMAVFKTITIRDDTRGKPPSEETKQLFIKLHDFYDKYYKQCIIESDIMNDTKLNFIMAYEAIDIVKNIKNNITEHFHDYVNKFVNQSFEVKLVIDDINNKNWDTKTKDEVKNSIYADLRKVKKDLLKSDNNFDSDEMFHDWIKKHKSSILRKDKFTKNSVEYDICANPIDYIKSLFYMNKELEKINEERIKEEKEQFKLFQVIPQRTSIKSNYICLDTCSLINLVIEENSIEYLNNVEKYQKELWEKHFYVNQKEFKRKGYQFNYMIKTDGIGCSVLLVKLVNGKPIEITSKKQKELKEKLEKRDKIYIENVKITNKMKKKRIVCIDPNLNDLAYCVSKNIKPKVIVDENDKLKVIEEEEIITFRYTQNQRRLESRNKKYNKLQNKINKLTKINNKTVKQIETELSNHNSKTCDFNKFIVYCKKKNEVNRTLYKHYSQKLFRKLKFNRYTNTQKSESKMIKNFENKFGKPEECTIILGDYDKENNRKGKEPVINRRIRKIFRNHKYQVFMINEFKTSKLCNVCENVCSTFLKRESKSPKHKDKKTGKQKIIEVWGLTLCENKNCSLIHNRDKNSALNMYKITQSIYKGLGRPKIYCREIKPFIPA